MDDRLEKLLERLFDDDEDITVFGVPTPPIVLSDCCTHNYTCYTE